MAASGGAFVAWVGGLSSGAAAGTAATAVDAAAVDATATGVVGTAGTAAGTAGAAVGTAGTVASSAAGEIGLTDATAGLAAETAAAPTLGAIAPGVGDLTIAQVGSLDASAVSGASALAQLAAGRKGIAIPPTPGQATNDASIQQTEQEQLAREQAAGGLQSTTGTAGGQAGAVLNPSTTSNKSLLGG